jgi:hypothetical protein
LLADPHHREIGDLLLCGRNRVCADDETAGRRILAGNRNERSRELGGLAGLPPGL